MIRYFDYRPEFREHRVEFELAWRRVLESGRLVLGPEVEAFESECAKAVAVDHAVGVNSGTDAIILALRALGIGAGDEVMTVANAGAPTVSAIRAVGAMPRFVDVRPEDALLDPGGLDGARTARTRCVIPVHLYGQAVDMDAVTEFARRHGMRVVEDCAQAQGARFRGRPVGSIGDVGCFSFYPTKTLGAFGDGGLCATADPDLAARIRMLRMYGFREDRHAHLEGLNSRLDELQAAVLRVKLRHLDRSIERRRAIARRYREALRDPAAAPLELVTHGDHVYHLFVVRVRDRPGLVETLRSRSIGFGIHYPEPAHAMEAFRGLGYDPGDLPVTEELCRTVLSLPIYPGMPDSDVDAVIDAVGAAA